jgi:hypothetical protein
MNIGARKIDYIDKYNSVGEQKFYRLLLSDAMNKLIKIRDNEYKGISPEMELLNFSERFLQLSRREGDTLHLELSRLFRKAAHKVYRIGLKVNMWKKNPKFLNLV